METLQIINHPSVLMLVWLQERQEESIIHWLVWHGCKTSLTHISLDVNAWIWMYVLVAKRLRHFPKMKQIRFSYPLNWLPEATVMWMIHVNKFLLSPIRLWLFHTHRDIQLHVRTHTDAHTHKHTCALWVSETLTQFIYSKKYASCYDTAVCSVVLIYDCCCCC